MKSLKSYPGSNHLLQFLMIMQSIPRSPIVDTGPLFDFLLWRFSVSYHIPTLQSGLRYIKEKHLQESVKWYFKVAKPIATCPQVVAEIHGHVEKNIRQPLLGNFWRFAQKELLELGLKEELVELGRMDTEILSSFGPTDTALLQIAGASEDLSRCIFTEDGDLKGKCQKSQVRALSIKDIQSIWQQHGSKSI